jgi:hypothetical protein
MDLSRHALLRCACPLVTPRRRSPEICRPREICRKKAKPDWLPNCPVDVAQLPQNSVFFIAIGRLGGSVTSELQPRNSIRGTLFDNKRGVQNVGLCRERWKASGAEAFGLDIPSCRNLPLRNANGVCLGEASPPTSQFRGLSCQACCISANGHDFPKLSRSHGQNGPVNGKFIPYGKRSRKTGASCLRRI